MADTIRGRKFYIAVTLANGQIPLVCPDDLDESEFEALNWQQVKGCGSIGQSGTTDAIQNYDELDQDVVDKAKGIANAGDPMIEWSRKPTDKGQIAMRAAGATRKKYAFKWIDDDMPSGGTNGTTYYQRGLVGGIVKPNGRQDAFNIEQSTLGLCQREVITEAA